MSRCVDYGFMGSPEYRAKQSAAWTLERRAAQSARRKARATGSYVEDDGYVILTMQDHPLARNGAVGEHRVVLYEKLGPEDPSCYWCGKTLLWRGPSDVVVCADHLDRDTANNDPDNLVPSCRRCNWHRDHQKLVDAEVKHIRTLYGTGAFTQKDIAALYGISPSMVSRIVNRNRRTT